MPSSLEVSSASSPEVSPPKTRPVTRQMAQQSGEEVWPWMKTITSTAADFEDDDFVVDEVEQASQENTTTLDGLQPPRSLNYLQPLREQAKLARKSDLELLKQSRLARQQRRAENAPTASGELVLPIFDNPPDESSYFPFHPTKLSRELSNTTAVSELANPQEALQVKRKRRREFEAQPDDYLPSFGPDFIIDDGSGYGVDPLYERHAQRPNGSTRHTPTFTATSLSLSSIRKKTHPTLRDTDSLWEAPDTTFDESSNNDLISISSTPSRHLSSRTISSSSGVPNDTDGMGRLDDSIIVGSERSNPASVASHSTTTSNAQSAPGILSAMQGVLSNPSSAQKLRLTVMVKEERLFISCPVDSTFSWLQQEAINKYRLITRMEVELDHLETTFGARLLPSDQIREYMNDLETVVAIIKESRPLDLVSLYKTDCQAQSVPEDQQILERLKIADSDSNTQHNGVHKLLPLSNLSISNFGLPSLRGILNLHSFFIVDISSNHLSSAAFCELVQEMCKSNSPELLQKFQISDNLLGFSLDVEPLRSIFSKFVGLTSLDVSKNMLNDRAIGALIPAILNGCPNLTDLNVSSNFFGYHALQTIEASPKKLDQVQVLDISRNPLHRDGFSLLLQTLGQNSSVETLNLAYSNAFSADLRESSLQHVAAMPTLEESVGAIGSNLKHLKHLSIRGCRIDTQSHPMLLPAMCFSLRHLSSLDMADCGLEGNDMRLLRTLVQSTSLTSLILSYNRLESDRKLTLELAMSTSQNQRLSLELLQCGIDQTERNELQTQIPNCRPLLQLILDP